MELGICTFAETTADPRTGVTISAQERLANLMEEMELADELGLDVFAVGEHHRDDFAVSSPATVLAAASQRTTRIRLSSGVTVLSSDDPVRVFQQFATVDLLSGGRAEVLAGRGSFTESYPLFGYDLEDYDELYAEKLDLLLALRDHERVTWEGRHRPALHDQAVFPRPVQERLPVGVAVGGTPQSVVRAGLLGLPITFAIIGGMPEQFAPLVQLYRDAIAHAGHAPEVGRVAINTHGYVGADHATAMAEFWPSYRITMDRVGRERGWPPMRREQFEQSSSPRGALMLGSSEEVAAKILAQHELFGHDRYLIQFSGGTLPHEQNLAAIRRFATEVAPVVRAEVARRREATVASPA
jgi:probable LLM family oxidoreductase